MIRKNTNQNSVLRGIAFSMAFLMAIPTATANIGVLTSTADESSIMYGDAD